MVKICQTAKTGLFPSDVTALGALGPNISSAAYWHKAFPYKSSLTGVSGADLADGYEKASGKQWTQQLGASLSLLDAGMSALQASGAAKDKAAVAKAMSTLKTTTIAGLVDFTAGPVPNVAVGPIIGTQWVKAKAGSKFPLDYVVTEHATDPNVPVEAKLIPYNSRRLRRAPMTETAPRLEAREIRKRFGALVVLDGVDFVVAADEAVGIVGPNGAGKTTLLSILSGAQAPTSGRVALRGRDVTALDSAARCRLGLVRTHQIPRPFSGMTAFENIFVAAAHGESFHRAEAYDRVVDALALCGMSGVANRRAETLGLLDRKRLELARALGADPEHPAARRDRRRPHRRRGQRTRRRHPGVAAAEDRDRLDRAHRPYPAAGRRSASSAWTRGA